MLNDEDLTKFAALIKLARAMDWTWYGELIAAEAAHVLTVDVSKNATITARWSPPVSEHIVTTKVEIIHDFPIADMSNDRKVAEDLAAYLFATALHISGTTVGRLIKTIADAYDTATKEAKP
jgi:hypothetical protein